MNFSLFSLLYYYFSLCDIFACNTTHTPASFYPIDLCSRLVISLAVSFSRLFDTFKNPSLTNTCTLFLGIHLLSSLSHISFGFFCILFIFKAQPVEMVAILEFGGRIGIGIGYMRTKGQCQCIQTIEEMERYQDVQIPRIKQRSSTKILQFLLSTNPSYKYLKINQNNLSTSLLQTQDINAPMKLYIQELASPLSFNQKRLSLASLQSHSFTLYTY